MVLPPSSRRQATVHRTVALKWFQIPIDVKNPNIPEGVLGFLAEMEGFEPPHALRRLADFESAPFSHLGTSPQTVILQQWLRKKSSCLTGLWFLFCKFHNIVHSVHNHCIALRTMGYGTRRTVFYARIRVGEIASTFMPQGIQRTITKQTVKLFRIRTCMAWIVFTFPVLKKLIMLHIPSGKFFANPLIYDIMWRRGDDYQRTHRCRRLSCYGYRHCVVP